MNATSEPTVYDRTADRLRRARFVLITQHVVPPTGGDTPDRIEFWHGRDHDLYLACFGDAAPIAYTSLVVLYTDYPMAAA